jgi:hypothetical protein
LSFILLKKGRNKHKLVVKKKNEVGGQKMRMKL